MVLFFFERLVPAFFRLFMLATSEFFLVVVLAFEGTDSSLFGFGGRCHNGPVPNLESPPAYRHGLQRPTSPEFARLCPHIRASGSGDVCNSTLGADPIGSALGQPAMEALPGVS